MKDPEEAVSLVLHSGIKGETFGWCWEVGSPWMKQDSPSLYLHRHNEYEVNLVRSGKGSYLMEGKRIDLLPGTLLWIQPGQAHQLVQVNQSFKMDVWIFDHKLTGNFLESPHPFLQPGRDNRYLSQLSIERTQWLEALRPSLLQNPWAWAIRRMSGIPQRRPHCRPGREEHHRHATPLRQPHDRLKSMNKISRDSTHLLLQNKGHSFFYRMPKVVTFFRPHRGLR